MNNQINLHPHYTLPGVMHYLQTEFTKNERDRIAWELERSEMKARIAQLEGENKDLQYQLMKLKTLKKKNEPGSDSAVNNANDVNLSDLMKSKMAVQDNVKEIIYLFKSPNITTQLRSLNEKKDVTHELENLNFNKTVEHEKFKEIQLGPSEIDQVEALKEAINNRTISPVQDAASDASTVIINDETTGNTHNGVRPRRSSSLFTHAKVESLDQSKEKGQSEQTETNEDIRNCSSLFQKKQERIPNLRAYENHLLTFSSTGQLSLWYIDNNFKCAELPLKTFKGTSSSIFDIYWLDMNKFLILDDIGLKLFTSESERPVSELKLFTEEKTTEDGGGLINISDILHHGFKKNALLLCTAENIYILEVSMSTKEYTSTLIENKRFTIPLQRKPLGAEFGMTEKSLIVLHGEPFELIIYNFQGKVLQKINLNKCISKFAPDNIRPVLHLNKKISKMLIEIQKLILVYSFDQKKIIVKYTLTSQPASIIFNSADGKVIIAYNDGSIEIRDLDNFDAVIESFSLRSEPSSSNGAITALDSTTINSTTVIVSSGNNNGIRLNALRESKE